MFGIAAASPNTRFQASYGLTCLSDKGVLRWYTDCCHNTACGVGKTEFLAGERQKRSAPILVRRERYERELAVALLAGCVC